MRLQKFNGLPRIDFISRPLFVSVAWSPRKNPLAAFFHGGHSASYAFRKGFALSAGAALIRFGWSPRANRT